MTALEKWKSVVGHAGYEVSDRGRVRSVDRVVFHRVKGRVLRPGKSSNGYPSVALGYKRTQTVHALVAAAFIGPRPQTQQVRHLDGNRSNSRADNLAYGTPTTNRADADRHHTSVRGSRYRTAKLTETKAQKIRALKGVVPQSVLARRYNVSPAAVQAVHDGRTWKHV